MRIFLILRGTCFFFAPTPTQLYSVLPELVLKFTYVFFIVLREVGKMFREAFQKKNWIFYDNLLISIATYPPYPIMTNIYDKAVIIEAPTYLQVIMTYNELN